MKDGWSDIDKKIEGKSEGKIERKADKKLGRVKKRRSIGNFFAVRKVVKEQTMRRGSLVLDDDAIKINMTDYKMVASEDPLKILEASTNCTVIVMMKSYTGICHHYIYVIHKIWSKVRSIEVYSPVINGPREEDYDDLMGNIVRKNKNNNVVVHSYLVDKNTFYGQECNCYRNGIQNTSIFDEKYKDIMTYPNREMKVMKPPSPKDVLDK